LAAARILVLCFNVTLASFLRGQLQALVNMTVCHFEGWAAANCVRRNLEGNESYETLGKRLLAILAREGDAGDMGRYDAVLVDEAQDFDGSWFQCVLAAMRDPVSGDLLIVGDGNQGIYRRGKISWKALGIQAQGRTISGRFNLEVNYRNSREIADLAQLFASGSEAGHQRDEDTIETVPLDVSRCARSTGWKPLLCKEYSREAECARAVTIVRDLLAGRWADEVLPESLRPEQIGILYRRIAKADQPGFARFLADLRDVAPVRWLNAKDDPKARTRVLEPGIKVQTIHAAKGLQYRAVILLWAGDLPYLPPQSQHDEQAERRLFYVGLTRAEDFLALTAPVSASQSPFIGLVESSRRVLVRRSVSRPSSQCREGQVYKLSPVSLW
jgi:superfamily I DNA/RNA helicase